MYVGGGMEFGFKRRGHVDRPHYWSLRWRRVLQGILTFPLCLGLGLAAQARAQAPETRLVSAAAISPADAWTFYGSATAHTNGLAASPQPAAEVKALARSLGADRIGSAPGQLSSAEFTRNVFDYVRNNIAVEFRFGLGKGGLGALIDQSGTPFDQAELMRRLLAEGGVPAVYKVGVVNVTPADFGRWSGLAYNVNEATQSFDIDAKAACQYLADGGIPVVANGSSNCSALSGALATLAIGHIWLQVGSEVYDPSFKRHKLVSGIDLPAAMGCGTTVSPTCGAAVTSAMMVGAISGTTAGSPTLRALNAAGLSGQLQGAAVNLQAAIEASAPEAPLEGVVGGRQLDLTYQPAGGVLPYSSIVQHSWSGEIPDKYRATLRLQFLTFDKLFYADELAGRRLALDVNVYLDTAQAWLVLDGAQIDTTMSNQFTPGLRLTLDHPYSSLGGAYADQTVGSGIVTAGWTAIVLALGDATPARAQYYAEVEAVHPEVTGFGDSPPQMPGAMQYAVQAAQGARIVAGVTDTIVSPHHLLGGASLGGLSVSTYVSVNSPSGNIGGRVAAFRTLAAVAALLEGSAAQQASDSPVVRSMVTNLFEANLDGAVFAHVSPSNFAAIASQLSQNAVYQASVDSGATLIAVLSKPDTIVSLPNGETVRSSPHGFLAYSTDWESYLFAGAKGGGASPNAVDPTRDALAAIRQTPINLEKAFSADVASGNLTLAPAPDLVTGGGEFPTSLAFSRYYSTGAAFDERGDPASLVTPTGQYAGPDASVFGRIGGNWTHNFQIYARISNDGLLGLGDRRAVDAAAAIAAIVTIADQQSASAPTFQNRMGIILTGAWLSDQLLSNAVTVSAPPASVTFVRRPSGLFAPPPGSADRLTVLGARAGPYAMSTMEWPYHMRATTLAWDYEGVSLIYGRSTGDVMTLAPSKWSPSANSGGDVYEALFYPTIWGFPDGRQLSFAYDTVGLSMSDTVSDNTSPRKGRKLHAVSTNLGRSLTFTTAGDFLTAVTDETGRSVTFSRDCGINHKFSCNSLSVTAPGGGVTRYEYTADAASPEPSPYVRSGHRLRRWYTPSNASIPYRTFAYDALARLKASIDPFGNETGYAPGALTGHEAWKRGEVLDAAGGRTVGIYNLQNAPLSLSDPAGRVTRFTYDDANRLVLKVLPEGDAEVRTYDVRSNLLTSTLRAKPGSGLADRTTTTVYGEGVSVYSCVNPVICNRIVSQDGPRADVNDATQYDWNATTGLLTQVLGPMDVDGVRPQIDLSYASYGTTSPVWLPSTRTEKISAVDSLATTYEWNSSNKYVLKSATVDQGGLSLKTCFEFDASGNLVGVTDARAVSCPGL